MFHLPEKQQFNSFFLYWDFFFLDKTKLRIIAYGIISFRTWSKASNLQAFYYRMRILQTGNNTKNNINLKKRVFCLYSYRIININGCSMKMQSFCFIVSQEWYTTKFPNESWSFSKFLHNTISNSSLLTLNKKNMKHSQIELNFK